MLPSSRALAQRANAELPPLAADDPWRRQIAATHEALAAKGLPTSAPDVHVVVVEAGALETAGGGPPRVSSHAGAVVRTIGALAPGADTELLSARPPPSSSDLAGTLRASPSHIADLRAHEMLSERVRQGDVSLGQLARWSGGNLASTVDGIDRNVASVASGLRPGGPTTIMNMSFSFDALSDVQRNVIPALLTSPAGSRLDQEARRLIDDPAVHAQLRERYAAHPPRMENLSPAERAGMAHISDPTMRAVLDHLKSADGQETLDSAKARFAATVSAARDRGLLVFSSAGNQWQTAQLMRGGGFNDEDRRRASVSVVNDVPGILTVGATRSNNTATPSDDIAAPFSSPGQVELSFNGVAVPVGRAADGSRKLMDGTSFASPGLAAVAALMLQANPELKPADIERLLKRAGSQISGATRVGGREVISTTDRDGISGAVDAVRAVELAAAERRR